MSFGIAGHGEQTPIWYKSLAADSLLSGYPVSGYPESGHPVSGRELSGKYPESGIRQKAYPVHP